MTKKGELPGIPGNSPFYRAGPWKGINSSKLNITLDLPKASQQTFPHKHTTYEIQEEPDSLHLRIRSL